MAYTPENLELTSAGLSNTGNQIWTLNTTDPIGTVNTDNYVSDGVTRGVGQGDLVWVKTRSSLPEGDVTAINLCFVSSVGSGADAKGVDLTDGLSVPAADAD